MDHEAILPGLGSGGTALAGLDRPVIILVGHFGSGKTEIAVNLAFGLRNRGEEVTLADLDLVKPYFRCRSAKEDLVTRGITLVAPEGEGFYADLPILMPQMRSLGSAPEAGKRILFDVGGDDLGARVLGSVSGTIDRSRADLFFVVNANRPFAEDLPAMQAMFHEVQGAARMPITGLIANTHLMEETTPATVREGIRVARDLGDRCGLPVRFCAIMAPLAGAMGGPEGTVDNLPILSLERHIVAPFIERPAGAKRRSSVV